MTLDKNSIIITSFICIILLCTGIASAATYSGGSGTVDNPYQLSSDSDIDNLSVSSDDWGMNFTLTNDITLVGNHTPIGIDYATPFTGDFNGSGFAIKNLTIYYTATSAGFFGQTGSSANIHDLGVETSPDGVFSTTHYVGILVGINSGNVVNSSATGNVTGVSYVGGLIGYAFGSGTVINSYAAGNVTGSGSYVGGLAGYNSGIMNNSYAIGNVTGSGINVGGLVGYNDAGTVNNGYATGNVNGAGSIGGLVGYSTGVVTNSFATGTATTSSGDVGGLMGKDSGTVTNSYYSGTPTTGNGTSTSYDNFTSFAFVSGSSGLNWNASDDIITTEDNSSFIWRIDDGSSLPYFQNWNTVSRTETITLYVGSGVDCNYTTIQAAVDNSIDGDTIIVTDGTYNENVVVDKSVTLRSEKGSASTIVNASDSSDHVFNVTVDNVTIDGFNVTGATSSQMAGIYLGYSNNSKVTNNIATANYYGIILDDSNDNMLTGNVASNNYEDGIYFSSSDNNTLTSSIANYNGEYGVYLLSSNNNTLTDNVANNNTYSRDLTSMSVDSPVEVMDSIIRGSPTGFYISSSDNNILTGNTANYNTGGFEAYMLSVSDTVISPDLTDVSRYSCGFSLSGSDNTTMADNTAIGNEDYTFYSRYSYDNTVDKLKMAERSMQLTFVTETSEVAVKNNESSSSAPAGMINVNGYIDVASMYDPNMTIYYDDSGMSNSVESSISLFELNGNEWVKVPNASLSTSGNYVSVVFYRLQDHVFDGVSIDEITSTYGLFRSIPSSDSRSDDDGVRASVSQGQDPGIVSNSASSVKRVTGDSDVNYDFSDSDSPVLGVSFEAKKDKGLVVAKVQVLSTSPEGVPDSTGKSYQKVSIDVGSEGTISSDSADNIQIRFKVSKQWIEENNIDVSTIRMTRYHGEQWNNLPTYQEREEGDYIYFYAETPGFSIFEVVGDENTAVSEQIAASESANGDIAEPTEGGKTANTPGFTAIAGIVFVSLVVLMRRK
ncbi:MAG: hypothetical protein PWQ75_727 [Methanolobus sp.]|jgi:PGF-pre-PGF domain-containing protein|uniref:PGF-pre-PGF domain-containing protein n=1 Tax=Methanolobus sp. TaxID=1874737 RepID=UPI002582BA5F|nr:PGF-pre-PGF domain-containing protein [Methanolobus sp.]MDK2830975.1 hypothetical protein [Methanolobus sp.]